MPTPLIEIEHWRRRADEARASAGMSSDPLGKKTMRVIADSYDRLAAVSELLLEGKNGSKVRQSRRQRR
jgi:hypothetical protein